MHVRGVDFVMYEVSDLERSIAFYRDILGLKLTMHIADYGWAELDAKPLTLALFDPAQARPEAPRPRIGGAAVESIAPEELSARVSVVLQETEPRWTFTRASSYPLTAKLSTQQ